MNQGMFKQYKDDYLNKYKLLCFLAEKADNSSVTGNQVISALIADLMTAPSVHDTETKTAHWVDRTDWLGTLAIYQYACSNCGFTIGHKPFNRVDGRGDKHCEECGCKMTTEEGATK